MAVSHSICEAIGAIGLIVGHLGVLLCHFEVVLRHLVGVLGLLGPSWTTLGMEAYLDDIFTFLSCFMLVFWEDFI